MLLNPISMINDGQMELLFTNTKLGFKGMMTFMDQAIKHGGIHGYDKNVTLVRGKSLRFVNKNPKTGILAKDLQVFAIDGEVLWFTDFVQYDVEYEGLEVLVDYQDMMESQGHFLQ